MIGIYTHVFTIATQALYHWVSYSAIPPLGCMFYVPLCINVRVSGWGILARLAH